ncbi:alanine racemase [Ammoniphilus sp. CFH 90114]|uniref:alanine racemase n=1 Tax=Ammoniphilus sp. CFH 90114 TaxID=2493665 RepID=UPI00100E3908|nr:alanine racemase [Ammoniphilus sp. CFH 90114]RXT04155.1 hypothetical protein EIZ39_21500 [Ammoniphilus sp. CFH 90114]
MPNHWVHHPIDTPAVLVHQEILQKNIHDMAVFAKTYHLALRPHIKTHKIPEIARMQLAAGAVGVTTAKLGEAEVMAAHGITDILIAYPIIGKEKLKRLEELRKIAKVMTVVDGREQALELSQYANERNLQFEVLMEMDSGLRRCGVLPGQDALALYRELAELPGIRLQGIMTHAGHAYGATGIDQVREIALQEGTIMVETAQLLREADLAAPEVSVGSTPTVRISGQVEGVTEIRPGNYVFNDLTQIRLGVATQDQCALRVATRIVSKPAEDRFIIDAGAKTFALDQGAHGTTGVSGYGRVVGHPECTIARLSEEHGIVIVQGATKLQVGDIIEIIPNHSCPVANLTNEVHVVSRGVVSAVWKVAARGKTS